MAAKKIMIQGTMSNSGKSFLTAALCRIFWQDGYRTAPFKSQNMALNSYITEEGLEMGRAQVMQCEAAGIKPSVNMNPILLKPTNDMGSQVIVNGTALSFAQVSLPNNSTFTGAIEISGVTLEQGANSIVLKTNNNTSLGGTYAGIAPMVDCIKIETSAVLIWDAVKGLPMNY